MKILGVGLNKTGTTSLQHALRILGFKTEGCTRGAERLSDVLDGSNNHPDFRRFDDIDAIFDLPTAYFYDEIIAAYPGIKCILTVRDEDRWWASIQKHFNERTPTRSKAEDPLKWQWRTYAYGSATAREFLYRKKYREHNERVARVIPAECLLTMDIESGDGWPELCSFLGLAVPDQPFPHQNPGNTNAEKQRQDAVAVIARFTPPSQQVILVDENWLTGALPGDARMVPFPERDGQQWGKPENDDAAISELERLRGLGARYIFFAEPGFWWLDYYAEFHSYLAGKYPCIVNNDLVIGFDLSGAERTGNE